jgi:hypothetical protein
VKRRLRRRRSSIDDKFDLKFGTQEKGQEGREQE